MFNQIVECEKGWGGGEGSKIERKTAYIHTRKGGCRHNFECSPVDWNCEDSLVMEVLHLCLSSSYSSYNTSSLVVILTTLLNKHQRSRFAAVGHAAN